MPEEVIPIIVIAILAFTGLSIFVIHTVFSYARERAGLSKKKQKDGQSSVTTSELEEMLKRVVSEANAPLVNRIQALEALESNRELSPAKPLLEIPDGDEWGEGPRDLAALSQARKERGTE